MTTTLNLYYVVIIQLWIGVCYACRFAFYIGHRKEPTRTAFLAKVVVAILMAAAAAFSTAYLLAD